MDPPPPSYADAVNETTRSQPVIITFYHFSYVRPAQAKGRRIGRRLGKYIDVVSIPKDIDNLDFALSQLRRAAQLFSLDGNRIERLAFTIILRIEGRKDAVVDDENWEAVCNFLTTPGTSFTSARLIMALGPVVKLTAAQRFGGLLLEAKRKVVGSSLPANLA